MQANEIQAADKSSAALRMVAVRHGTVTRYIQVGDATVSDFLRRAEREFNMEGTGMQLAFETSCGDKAAVSSDFALRLTLGAEAGAGRLVLVKEGDLASVDECMRTVLQAVVDTAARGEAAAVFLALSGAWEMVMRDFGERKLVEGEGRKEVGMGGLKGSLVRVLEGRVGMENGSCMADALMERMKVGEGVVGWETECSAAAERRLLIGFRKHEVRCARCEEGIVGTRYVVMEKGEGDVVNLCETCRRSSEDREEWGRFVVYEHPWESSEDYAEGGELLAPAPPLRVGDMGPRVMHLQYVLHQVGYLRVGEGFRVGVLCRRTEEALERLKRAFVIAEEGYGDMTRGILCRLFDEVERGVGARCANMGEGARIRVRTAMAA